jgi:hypothetical protein
MSICHPFSNSSAYETPKKEEERTREIVILLLFGLHVSVIQGLIQLTSLGFC